jgi:putative membrane protein/ATP adenylyltransferase
MRYIKVFLFVLLFFLIMMLFVQNQASFSDPVTLKFDPLFAPAMESMPLPRYALLLISFALGAFVVLAMLLWDRLTLSSRLAVASRRGNSLQKQLDKANAQIEKLNAEKAAVEAELAAAKAEAAPAE